MGSSLPEAEKDFSPALLQNLQVLLSSQDRESAQIQLTQVRDWPRESPCQGPFPPIQSKCSCCNHLPGYAEQRTTLRILQGRYVN